MKANNHRSNKIIYVLLAVVALFIARYIAPRVYNYETITKGILGISNLCLIYILFFSQGSPFANIDFDKYLSFPENIKSISITLLLYLIIYWSSRYVINIILEFIN